MSWIEFSHSNNIFALENEVSSKGLSSLRYLTKLRALNNSGTQIKALLLVRQYIIITHCQSRTTECIALLYISTACDINRVWLYIALYYCTCFVPLSADIRTLTQRMVSKQVVFHSPYAWFRRQMSVEWRWSPVAHIGQRPHRRPWTGQVKVKVELKAQSPAISIYGYSDGNKLILRMIAECL